MTSARLVLGRVMAVAEARLTWTGREVRKRRFAQKLGSKEKKQRWLKGKQALRHPVPEDPLSLQIPYGTQGTGRAVIWVFCKDGGPHINVQSSGASHTAAT